MRGKNVNQRSRPYHPATYEAFPIFPLSLRRADPMPTKSTDQLTIPQSGNFEREMDRRLHYLTRRAQGSKLKPMRQPNCMMPRSHRSLTRARDQRLRCHGG
jgi:hypothetical protein